MFLKRFRMLFEFAGKDHLLSISTSETSQTSVVFLFKGPISVDNLVCISIDDDM